VGGTGSRVRRSGRCRRDQPVLQTLVIAFRVRVLSEGHERAAEVRLAEDHEAVQAFLLDRSDEPFRMGIAVRRAVWGLDHANPSRVDRATRCPRFFNAPCIRL
jgi:hypothetical protein